MDELLQQYTETLCTAQQKTTFTSNVLQDIIIFTGTDSSQTEDPLTDIKTAANLTHNSHTKLAQAKSKGLTHTLICEALSSDKSWNEVKDLLHRGSFRTIYILYLYTGCSTSTIETAKSYFDNI